MHHQPVLTEGALRVSARAAALAAAAGAAAVDPEHLLAALIHDESRAAELLAPFGIEAPLDDLDEPSPTDAGTIPPGEVVTAVERAATDAALAQAARTGQHVDIGTEHLLWGLLHVASPVSERLHEAGLRPERLEETVEEQTGFTSEPLEAEFEIRWSDRSETVRLDTLRILDAAANRAREGLRVVEDYARFVLDDGHLSQLLKECRHDLASALARLEGHDLLAARDTDADVGTRVSTPSEQLRASPLDVVRAGLKRTQEALRTLEEYGKVLDGDLAGRIEQIRYRTYTVEKALLLTAASRERLQSCVLCLLLTGAHCPTGPGPALHAALDAGLTLVQVREKGLGDRALLDHARRVRRWTRERGALLIMNDRPDLAVLSDADGVHVGQDECGVRDARRIVGPHRLVGVSTHSIEQARQAVREGADYLGVGPVFPSRTKTFDRFAGLEFVRQVAAEISLPWFAIGGITLDNLEEVVEAGARRVAISHALCSAADPREATRSFLDRLA